MTRRALLLSAWLLLASTASASLTPVKDLVPVEPRSATTIKISPELFSTARTAKPEYVVTSHTAVTLDGKECKYEDIPGRATIVRMELAADKRTVLRIHFRTSK